MAKAENMGTVTPLDHLYTFEEAVKASKRVEKSISDCQKELSLVRNFISDNSALIHHVKKLPEEPSYSLMVPFGGAAFFPGRLIHTNEFLVLLGEGYFAERSGKQTVEILQRRGESLLAHLESLRRIVKDLEVEASFFNSTAAEVAEGLVDIREEYVERTQTKKLEIGEEDDAKLMARLDELEKEEEEAGSDIGDDEDAETASTSEVDDDENKSYLKVEKYMDDEAVDDEDKNIFCNAENILGTDVQVSSSKEQVASAEHSLLTSKKKVKLLKCPPSSIQAFTGTIIEHSYGLSHDKSSDETASGQPSRPISRFKLQKYKF